MKLSVRQFADKAREAKPEYAHLDDADLIQIVTQRKPEWLSKIDRDDLIKVSNESVSKQLSKERQKQFGALSGYSRFMAGTGAGMADVYQGVKQLFGGNTDGYKGDKEAYMDASKGSKTAAVGEIFGALAATAPIPGLTGAKLASKVVAPLAKTAIKLGTAGAVGAGFGATEFVDDAETRAKNALLGGLFGAGGAGAGMLVKKVGTKAYNALKGRYADANVQEIMDLAKKYDIPLPESAVTGKGGATEKALGNIPLVGMAGYNEKGAAKAQAAIKKEAESINPSWDEAIQESLASKARAGKAQAKINYDKVDELASGVSIDPENGIAIASKHEADIADSIMGSETNPFSKIRKNLSKKSRTFADLRKDRSDLQKAAVKASDDGDRILARQLNDVKDGIEADIEKLIDKKVEAGTLSQAKERVYPHKDPYVKDFQNNGDIESVGFRYGDAPPSGFSFNQATGESEKGTSLVSAAGLKGTKSAAVAGAKSRGISFYKGKIINESGGDNEFLMKNPQKITKKEYEEFLKTREGKISKIALSGAKSDRWDTIRSKGYDVGTSVEDWDDFYREAVKDLGDAGSGSSKIMGTQKEGLKEAFHTAKEQYKRDVVPYVADKKIINAIKTETPDEVFKKFVQKGNGDKAGNFYSLLDDKGKKAFKDGLIDNAIRGATTEATGDVSPKKLSAYLYRMSNPIESSLKGVDLEQVKGLAKIMHHAERYGQLNENPSNGMSLIPYLKTAGLLATGAGGITRPGTTALTVGGGAILTGITSLMKTKGYKVALASDKIGSPAFEKALNEIIAQLPKVSAVTGKELKD